jgi:hypothetical protein
MDVDGLVRNREGGIQELFLNGRFHNNVGSEGPDILVDIMSKF